LAKFVLTADRVLFTDFNGVDALGFGLCVPCRLIPGFVEYHVLPPRAGRGWAPYALAEVEAALLQAGLSRGEVEVAPPEELGHSIGPGT
jgi:hypothetical protein